MKEPKLTRGERELLDKLSARLDTMPRSKSKKKSSRTKNRPRLNDALPFPPRAVSLRRADLSKLEEEFVLQYTGRCSYDAVAAVIAAQYPQAGRAHIIARQLLDRPDIQQAIATIRAERIKRMNIDGEAILKQAALIAVGDPNEVVQLRVLPCRYCYGKNNMYQRTFGEMTRALELYSLGYVELPNGDIRRRRRDDPPFDEAGGDGYDRDMPPNPKCPECQGWGERKLFLKDSRYLSPEGRALFAGVKETRNGIEVLLHNQQAAQQMFARIWEHEQELRANTPMRQSPLKLTEMSTEDLTEILELEAELDAYDNSDEC